jgi:hypothetical protein
MEHTASIFGVPTYQTKRRHNPEDHNMKIKTPLSLGNRTVYQRIFYKQHKTIQSVSKIERMVEG